jgi:transcriptional regulator with XRE-family HTH domain
MTIQSMPLRNRVKALIDGKGITRYQFCKDTGLTQNTGYRLYKDPDYIPGADALLKICKAYNIQPGSLIEYIPEDDNGNQEAITEQEKAREHKQEVEFLTPSKTRSRKRSRSLFAVIPGVTGQPKLLLFPYCFLFPGSSKQDCQFDI